MILETLTYSDIIRIKQYFREIVNAIPRNDRMAYIHRIGALCGALDSLERRILAREEKP